MEKEFIPYEQALSLELLGSDEPCFATIDQTEYVHIKRTKSLPRGSMMYDTIDCPSYPQAFRLFREKYGLHCVYNVGIPHDNIHHSKKIKYYFNIIKLGKNHDNKFRSCFYETYEEAELECLKKLIEIVKNK
jgi:hypothetical protein